MLYFKKRFISLCIFFLMTALSYLPSGFTAPLSNQNSPSITVAIENEALWSFHHAMQDANNRLDTFRKNRLAVALIQTSEDLHGNIFQQRFTPKAYSKEDIIGSWNTLKIDEQFDDSITVDDNIFFESDNIDMSSIKLLHETPSTWVFRIANIINVDIEDDDDSTSQSSSNLHDEISENLFTDITIDKTSSIIKSLKVYAGDAFKPSWMITIEKFELRLNFKEAWPKGPMIRQSMSRHIKGQYGWLASLDELVTTELSSIKKVSLLREVTNN